MKQRSRRPGTGDGSNVLLGGERSEPNENTLKKQRVTTSTAFLEVRIAGRFVCLEAVRG